MCYFFLSSCALGYIFTDRPLASEYIVIYYDNYEYFTVHALNCQSGGRDTLHV